MALKARPETKQEIAPKASCIPQDQEFIFIFEKKTILAKTRYLKTKNLFLKYLSLGIMFLVRSARNFQEISVSMLSRNMNRTVQNMKPDEHLSKKKK